MYWADAWLELQSHQPTTPTFFMDTPSPTKKTQIHIMKNFLTYQMMDSMYQITSTKCNVQSPEPMGMEETPSCSQMNMVTGLPSGYDLLVNNLQDNNVTKMRYIVFCVLITCNLYVMWNMCAYWKSIYLPLYSPFAFFLSYSTWNIAYWRVQEWHWKIHHFKVKSKLLHDSGCQSVCWASF